MSNPLFNQFGGQRQMMHPILAQAQELQKQIQNPRQMVEHLMQTGQMSQEQFNQLSQGGVDIRPNLPFCPFGF